MKKRILFAVVAVVLVIALAACTGNTGKDDGNKVEIESSAALINSVWTTYAEEEKFPVMGGDFGNPVDGQAGAFNIADVENTTATLHITEDAIALVDEAGTMIHAMNANTFTAAAYHLKDAGSAETFVTSIKDSIKSTQWMCGFPDTLIIYTVGDYVVAAFGNAEAIENFKTKLATVYGENATLNVEESLA